MEQLKNIQFTVLIKAGGLLREFNFKKVPDKSVPFLRSMLQMSGGAALSDVPAGERSVDFEND